MTARTGVIHRYLPHVYLNTANKKTEFFPEVPQMRIKADSAHIHTINDGRKRKSLSVITLYMIIRIGSTMFDVLIMRQRTF